MKKIGLYTLIILILLIVGGAIYVANINNFKRQGSFQITKNKAPIKIHRDGYGIPYIIAENKEDAIRGQGFVAAQDRLFQIEFYRTLIKGELARIIGASMLQSDIRMRVLNLQQNAINNFAHLNDDTKQFLTWYCEGYNEYLHVGKNEFPIELSLLNIKPYPLTPLDVVTIIHFIGFTQAKNMKDEVLSMNLSATTDAFANDFFPFNINPDRTKDLSFKTDSLHIGAIEKTRLAPPRFVPPLLTPPQFGSNNWVISEEKSTSGKVIVCNDPHLAAQLLPGIFHPVGISCPEFKSVGISIPGVPGLIIGRNEYVAFGVTNAHGDNQDLFIEKAAGDYYFHEGNKLPFTKRKEVIQVKDSSNVEIEIRSTVRGPVVSDFDLFGIMTDDVVSLQWSQAASQSLSLGIEQFLTTKNVFELREALMGVDNMFFNFVMGDVHGNIAHQTTGLIPKRVNQQGRKPQVYTQARKDFIPKEEMPHLLNPAKGWVGTANHDTRPDDYPYYYSAHFSPNYRYLRIQEVLEQERQFDANDLWQLILDCKNKQAERLTPTFVAALNKEQATRDIAALLTDWNYHDDIHERGAAIYNVLYTELSSLILDDELPDQVEDAFWENSYYWSQRVDDMIMSNHEFIDNNTTSHKESLDDLIIEAGLMTKKYLSSKIGDDPNEWTWGNIHKVYFASPIRRKGLGSKLLGFEEFPKRGSLQTLNRGGYIKNKDRNYETTWFSTFRMVADLNDSEKFMGALAGGNAARIFHPYYKSQLETWKHDKWIPYWLSQDKVIEYSEFELVLE